MNYAHPHNLYLCLDQGGHASRAIVFDLEGNMQAQAFQAITPVHSKNGHIEYDAHRMLDSVREAIGKVRQLLGPRQKHLVAAGLATQRSNVVCWDTGSGQALSPVISWQDCRAADWLTQFRGEAEWVHKKTGLFMSPHYGASKLRWCLDNLPEVQRAAKENRLRFGPMASFLIYHLVREQPCFTDPVNAARTQLLNLDRLEWDGELLEMFGLPGQCLPQVVANQHAYGHLLESDDIPLTFVTGDQAAAMYAYGKIQPDTAYINMGSGAFLSRPSGEVPISSRRLLTSLILRHSDSSEYVLEATVNGASVALDWFAEKYNVPELEKKLPEWMLQSQHDAIFLNGIAGLGAPFWIPNFDSRFEGSTEIQHRAVAVAESITFLLKSGLDEMRKLASPPEQIQVSGGLANLDPLCQHIADLSGLPVYRPVECEATAHGLAYLLAGCPRSWSEAQPGIWFEPHTNPTLRQTYDTWLASMLSSIRQH